MMVLRIALFAVLALQVRGDFVLNPSGYAANKSSCTIFNAVDHVLNEVVEPSDLWDTQGAYDGTAANPSHGGGGAGPTYDMAGFLYAPSALVLTIAVPVLYEAPQTTIVFEADSTDSDMLAVTADDYTSIAPPNAGTCTFGSDCPSDGDPWTCETSHMWDDLVESGTNRPIDADTDGVDPDDADWVFDDDGDCYSVFRMSRNWETFRTDLGAQMDRQNYTQYNPDAANITAARAGTGGETGQYLEFCGEMAVTMWEEFNSIGLDNSLNLMRQVTDRFVFCIVFQTQVTVSHNITVYDAPGYFQFLQMQSVANLDPSNANCSADMELNVVTMTQWPYMLKDFQVTGWDANANGNPGSPDNQYYAVAESGPYCASLQTYATYDDSESGGSATATLPDCTTKTPAAAGDCQDSNDPASGNCIQDWGIDFCNKLCEADGYLNVTFQATCRPTVPGTVCPLGDPPTEQTVTGQLILDSASYCAVLIESVDVDGQLRSFEDAGLQTLRNDFLTGDRAYFKGDFTANSAGSGGAGAAPEICGVSPMSVSIQTFVGVGAGPAIYGPETLWLGQQNDNAAQSYQDITGGGMGVQTGATVDDLNFHMYAAMSDEGGALTDCNGGAGTECVAIDCDGNCTSGTTVDDRKYNLVGFYYDLDATLLAPPEHGTFVLETTLVVEVFFCGTGAKKLLELVYEYKSYNNPTNPQALQLQEGPQNLMEVGSQVGIFDPFPEENVPVESEATPAGSEDIIIGKPEEDVGPNGGRGGGHEIWPIIAGVVGGVTVCVIVLLIALRRRQSKKKTKTVAVIPDAKEYGPVAVDVAATEVDSESP